MIIERTTDLTPFVGVPVRFTRTLDDSPLRLVGEFTLLTHNRNNLVESLRTDDAGGMFTYVQDGVQHSTGLWVPYGSTIELLGEAAA